MSGLDEFHPDTTTNPAPRFDAAAFAFIAACVPCGAETAHKTMPEAVNWRASHRCQEMTT